MRDTSLLRHRLHTALACLPLAAAGLVLGACGPAAQAPPAAAKAAASSDVKDPILGGRSYLMSEGT